MMIMVDLLVDVLSAQAAAPATPGFLSMLSQMIPMFLMVGFVFYVLVISPQNKKYKAQEALLAELKKGDQVATSSGILGKVAGIEESHILVELAPNTKVKFSRDSIVKKLDAAA